MKEVIVGSVNRRVSTGREGKAEGAGRLRQPVQLLSLIERLKAK